jgi:glutamyl-tRNA synthetase
MTDAPTVRFAPSPTGLIHLGNARTALLNWCVAKQAGGRFILRFDDTDRERSRDDFARAIAEDLAWLGMEPDVTVRQADRGALYDAAAEQLKAMGRLYPAYETEEELDKRRRLARASGRPPIYDRAALKLTAEDRARLEGKGRRPHWRFRLDQTDVTWNDLVRGEQSIDAASLSDPVLVREDGTPLYTFTSVVDDIDLGVTHVVRGEDHVTNTAVQIQIFSALGAASPKFAHHNLLVAASGAGLSKREGSLSVASLREAGIEPQALAAYVTLVGSSEAVRPVGDLHELAGLVDLSRLSRSPSHVEEAELAALNAKVVHALAFEQVAERLDALGVHGGEAFWDAVRPNLAKLADAADWWRIATDELPPVKIPSDEFDVATSARDKLPPAPWTEETWKAWTTAIGAETGRKGRALFHPLRAALTGRDSGPDMKLFLPFIGPERAAARLDAALARR